MKFVAISILILFIAFLSVPTLVLLIEKKANVSMCFSSTEEELQKNVKEIKADLKLNFDYKFICTVRVKNPEIVSENLSKHDNTTEEIFSPPPELA